MTWVPTNDFEEEIVSLQPDYNFIFGNNAATTPPEALYPRPSAHLQFAANQKNLKRQQQSVPQTSAHSQKLSVIGAVQRIAGTKALGEQPTVEDWDTPDNIERETVAMMRHCGLGPSIEQPLDENCTIATLPITEDVRIMHNGPKRIPIFFDEKFFKLKPRVSNSSSGVESIGTTPNGSASTANDSMYSAASGSSGSTADSTTDGDMNASTGRHPICLPSRDAEMYYEKLQNIADESSESLGRFEIAAEETALEAEDSYATAYSSEQFIPSRSWYSKKSGRRSSSDSRHSDKSWRSGSSASSVASSSSHHSFQPAQHFYTARELYERKRHN